jgi:hypothetical protein
LRQASQAIPTWTVRCIGSTNLHSPSWCVIFTRNSACALATNARAAATQQATFAGQNLTPVEPARHVAKG